MEEAQQRALNAVKQWVEGYRTVLQKVPNVLLCDADFLKLMSAIDLGLASTPPAPAATEPPEEA